MRIDSNQEAQRAAENERISGQPAAGGAAASSSGGSTTGSSALGEDQAQLSGFYQQVQSLAAQVAALPETAPGKVEALRQAVIAGRYQPNPDEIAGALFSNMVVKLAA